MSAERVIAGYMTPTEFPHGTPAGFEQGCRNVCPGEATGQSCRQASIRYRGDFAYRRLVNDGAPVEVLRQPEVFVKPVKPKKVVAPKVEPEPKPRRADGKGRPVGSKTWRHGTLYGYNEKGCRAGSPCPGGADGRTCTQVKQEAMRPVHERRNEKKRAARAAAAEASGKRQGRLRAEVVRSRAGRFAGSQMIERAEHGTLLMYRRGCHTGDPCPAGEFGPTCAEVMAEYNRNYQKTRAPRKGRRS